MAPQPLSNVNPKAQVLFGASAFTALPELTSFVSRVINVGATMEGRWALMLADLLIADPKSAMAMYQALTSAEAKRAALTAAAKSRLDGQSFLLFQAAARVVAPQRRVRNQFAHHIWGTSPQINDALLLADPTFFIDTWVEYTSKIKHHGQGVRTVPAKVKFDRSKIDVWSRKSLLEAVRQADEADALVKLLGDGLHSRAGAAIGAQHRTQLLQVPQVAQALQRLSQQ